MKLEGLQDAYKALIDRYGFKNFHMELIETPDRYAKQFRLYYSKEFIQRFDPEEVQDYVNNLIKETFHPIIDDLKDSKFFKDAMAIKDDEINNLKKQLSEAEGLQEELQKYKDYYELTFKMQRGEW